MNRSEIIEVINARWPGEDNRARIDGALAVTSGAESLESLGVQRKKAMEVVEHYLGMLEGALLVDVSGESLRELSRRADISLNVVRRARNGAGRLY